MTTTGLRTRRRLGVVLAGALALGGLVALAPSATALQTGQPVPQTGVATWGLSDYLNSTNQGRPNPKSAFYVAPSTFTPAAAGPPAVPALSTWGQGTGTVASDGSATLAFKGATANWALTGNSWLTLADVEATFDATGTGSVSALVSYGTTAADAGGDTSEAARWAARTTTAGPTRVTLVDLSPAAGEGDATYPAALAGLTYTHAATPTQYSWSGLKGRWSTAFQTFLAGNFGTVPATNGCQTTSTCWAYASTVVNTVASNVSRYPAEFRFSIDRTVAATTATASLDGDGIKVAVDGTGFLKTAPGLYVSLREVPNPATPYAGGSVTPDLGTAWVSDKASDIGPDPATGAGAALGDDGAFSVDLELDAAAVAKLDPTKSYTVVTRKAHGQGTIPANASQVTETPVAIAALKQTTSVAAPSVNVVTGAAAVVNATVTPAGTGTPTGTVVVKDGDTVKGTGTLTNGTAAISIPGLAVGSKSYALEYSGANGYWKSAGTVTITVTAKKSTVITPAGPATVGYRTAATYTATLTNGATGKVVISGAGATVERDIVAGRATFVLPATLPAGARTLSFAYGGDANTGAAATVTKKIVVDRGAAVLTSKVTAKWTAKKSGRLTVKVASAKGGPVPTGKVTVTLKKGASKKTLSAKVLSNGSVVFKLPKSKKGTWTVKVTYVGSSQHKSVMKTSKVKVASK